VEHIFPVINKVVDAVLGGGPGVMAVLLILIGFLLWDRWRMTKEITRYQDRIDKIIDDYHQGNLTLADALNSLKLVLYEIKATMGR
jgi:hypothetical protein